MGGQNQGLQGGSGVTYVRSQSHCGPIRVSPLMDGARHLGGLSPYPVKAPRPWAHHCLSRAHEGQDTHAAVHFSALDQGRGVMEGEER